MEVLFTYISALGETIDLPINILNHYTTEFFHTKSYSKKVKRFGFIIVPKNFSTEELEAFKTKIVGQNTDMIGISIYLDQKYFLANDVSANLEYLHSGIINTFSKNPRLKSTLESYSEFIEDLNRYFARVKSLEH